MNVYTYDLQNNIEKKIPKSILNALSEQGWNVFGIYETVQEEIKKINAPKKKAKPKKPPFGKLRLNVPKESPEG